MTEPHNKRRDIDYLNDMIEYAERYISFCNDIDLKTFESDSRTFFAVAYCI